MGMQFKNTTGEWIEVSGPMIIGQEPDTHPLVIERREKFSFPFGDAELVQIMFSNIHIVHGDFLLRTRGIRMRTIDIPDLIELHFSLSGGEMVTNHFNGLQHRFDANEHNIMYVPEFDGVGIYEGHQPRQFFEIHFLASHFLELVKGSGHLLERFAEKVANREFADLGARNLPITIPMHQCIRDIMQCSYTGRLKFLFLQSKCIELLTMQAMAFEQALQSLASSVIKSTHDKNCILYAREYLLQHIDTPPTLTELAAIAGTNEFKLKKGFKELFNNTVFGYLSDTKLTQAKMLLQNGCSIKAVADQLGYSSVQHFSTAFKKKFGVPPGKA